MTRDLDRVSVSGDEAMRIVRLLGLGAAAVLARSGRISHMWEVVNVLDKGPPEGVSLDWVLDRTASVLDPLDVQLELAELIAIQTVELTDTAPPHYRLTHRGASVAARSGPDIAQSLLEAIRRLARDVLPAAEVSRDIGRFVSGELELPRGEGERAVSQLMDMARVLYERAASHPVEGERDVVSFVVGAGLCHRT